MCRLEARASRATAQPPVDTDLSGNYRLYGVPGNGTLLAQQGPGDVTKAVTLSISDYRTENVHVALAGPRVDVAGLYQMTFDASDQCRGSIPDALSTRRYTAAVTQRGSELQVVVSGARFIRYFTSPPSDTTVIPGGVERGIIYLHLVWPTHCDVGEPNSTVVEAIDDTTYLEIAGGGALLRSGEGFSGLFGGHFIVRHDYRCGAAAQPKAICRPDSYRVTLTR